MSAAHIPNLLSSRRPPRLRGRGGRGPADGHGTAGSSASSRRDHTVQATDTDAAVSRLSAVALGYLDDPFARFFVDGGSGTRRLPIINRGTYTRTTALDALVDAFLSLPDPSTQTRQIVSLGAGTDTRYLRLRAQNRHRNLVYHEFDFPSVCAAKHRIVDANIPTQPGEGRFPDRTTPPEADDPEWGFLSLTDGDPQYICHPLDLRQLAAAPSTASFRGLRADVPTLLISECCLCYLDVGSATDVVRWFVDRVPELGIVLYEPVGADDAFGQMMTENLAARGITMPTVQRYKTLADQRERLAALGFRTEDGGGGNAAESVERVWETWVAEEERERVDGLEGLDEVEEWQMLARHYAVVWGWKGQIPWESWMKPLRGVE